MEKILKMKPGPPVRAYVDHAYPLSVLYADENTSSNWLLDKYLCLYYNKADHKLDFLSPLVTKQKVLETSMEYEEGDIITFLMQRIDMNLYAILFVDEFFIPRRRAYKQYNFSHQLLIYGYSDEKKIFHTIGYDENEMYQLQEIGYDEMKNGFLKSQAIHCLKINETYDTEYVEEERVKLLLSDYLAGDNKTALNVFYQNSGTHFKQENCSFGIHIYDDLNENLSLSTLANFYTFKEHKYILKNLLDYFNKANKLDTYINEFYEILDWSEDLRSLCLKFRAKGKIDDSKIVTEIINSVKKKEISILSEVMKII